MARLTTLSTRTPDSAQKRTEQELDRLQRSLTTSYPEKIGMIPPPVL